MCFWIHVWALGIIWWNVEIAWRRSTNVPLLLLYWMDGQCTTWMKCFAWKMIWSSCTTCVKCVKKTRKCHKHVLWMESFCTLWCSCDRCCAMFWQICSIMLAFVDKCMSNHGFMLSLGEQNGNDLVHPHVLLFVLLMWMFFVSWWSFIRSCFVVWYPIFLWLPVLSLVCVYVLGIHGDKMMG